MIEDNKIIKKLDKADNLLAQGKYGEAITLLAKIRKLYPEEESVLLRLAWASWDNGDKERSIEYWEILLDRELQRKVFTGFAYDELVRIYKQEGNIEKLVAICETAVLVQPLDIGLLTELGNTYLLAGDIEKACDAFKKLTSMEADNPAFHCRLGEALMAAGKEQEAEDAYHQAGRLDPEDADRYLFQAADLFAKAGNFNAAKKLLTKCLELAPANSLYYCSLGDILVALKQPDDAFAAYEKACQQNRLHTAVYFNRLGNSLMRAEFFTRAIVAFGTALASDASIPCHQSLAAAYLASGQSPSRASNV